MSNFPLVFQRTMEMLRDRKYILPSKLKNLKLPSTSKDFFDTYHGNVYVKQKIPKSYRKNKKKKYRKILLFFSVAKFGVKELRLKMEQIKSNKIDHVIFILEHKFTLHGQKLLTCQARLGLEKEIFYFSELLINAVNHEFVPKHELLTNKETKQLIETVGKKIPCIKKNDIICRHFNGKIGQIFKIYRKNEIYYRMIIN